MANIKQQHLCASVLPLDDILEGPGDAHFVLLPLDVGDQVRRDVADKEDLFSRPLLLLSCQIPLLIFLSRGNYNKF